MPDILHDFIIKAPPQRVFAGVSVPRDLDEWWTTTHVPYERRLDA